ncbi:MAG TPA: antitoxin [Candidatus Omnitrophota bacterium]|nr:antitoxin [Candidatus Omnitrophota bacterium]
MKKLKLTHEEKLIEETIEQFTPVSADEHKDIVQAIESRKKDAVLNIRVNSNDIKTLKQKAEKLGIKYQTFISEILHKVAQA